jgi:hypothetical protein
MVETAFPSDQEMQRVPALYRCRRGTFSILQNVMVCASSLAFQSNSMSANRQWPGGAFAPEDPGDPKDDEAQVGHGGTAGFDAGRISGNWNEPRSISIDSESLSIP